MNHCILGTVLNVCSYYLYLPSQHPVIYVINPILQIRNLRHTNINLPMFPQKLKWWILEVMFFHV